MVVLVIIKTTLLRSGNDRGQKKQETNCGLQHFIDPSTLSSSLCGLIVLWQCHNTSFFAVRGLRMSFSDLLLKQQMLLFSCEETLRNSCHACVLAALLAVPESIN